MYFYIHLELIDCENYKIKQTYNSFGLGMENYLRFASGTTTIPLLLRLDACAVRFHFIAAGK